ncbi:hypothetical protein [Wukongibacter sp. M2B1]|uniref:hypothetical protein n=1 Tax=Wukongibacter sp. M2B1 TaxID=3088895 RepID=UPI003D78E926
MNSIQLKKLACKITHKIFEGETYDVEGWLDYMFKRIDVIGQNNKHLRNPRMCYNIITIIIIVIIKEVQYEKLYR